MFRNGSVQSLSHFQLAERRPALAHAVLNSVAFPPRWARLSTRPAATDQRRWPWRWVSCAWRSWASLWAGHL